MSNWRQILSWQTIELENSKDLIGWLVCDKSSNPTDYAVIVKVDSSSVPMKDKNAKFWGIWRDSEQEALDAFYTLERHKDEMAFAVFYYSDWKEELIPIRKIK